MDEELHQFVHLMSLREWIGLAVVLFGSAALWGAEAVFVWRLIGMRLESWGLRGGKKAANPQPPSPKPQASPLPRPSRRWWLIHFACAIYLAIFLYARLVEPNRLVEQRLVIESDKVPAGTTLRIVQVTDLHAQAPRGEQLERAAAAVAALKPDLVALTGDYLCNFHLDSIEALLGFIRRLPETTTVAVPGNYEGLYPADPFFEEFGVEMLHTEWRKLVVKGVPIELLGLSPTRTADVLPRPRHPAWFGIILEHFPALLPAAAASGWDLYLAGHTHGGQVRLPFYGAIVTLDKRGKEFEWGAYRLGRTVGVVSAGIGMECRGWPQVRFLCPPEIVLIEVRGTRR